VACGHPLASFAGTATFRDGGGAVDAAIAAAAALTVLMPEACGLGGDAFFLIHTPDGEVTAINGSGAAGATVSSPIATEGAASAAVPGFVAAIDDAQQRFGRLPLERLLEPAVSLAGGGFPLHDDLLGAAQQHRGMLERWAPGFALLDRQLRPGSLLRQPALAGLLQRIGQARAQAFYEGDCAEAVERAVTAAGGSLAASDLAAHTSVVRAPARGSYRGFELNMQPPVSQALIAARVLAAIERSGVEERADRMHVAVEGLEAAFQDRHDIIAEGAEERQLSEPLEVDLERAQRRGGPVGGLHTTAVSAADSDGVVVSGLISVFSYFGSGVLVPECGFLLNNRLSRASTDPESPNYPVGGRRPLHTLSPSLLVDGERVFALSTPGADGQVQTLVQTIDAIATDGDSIPEALDRPRWRSNEGSLLIEDDYDPNVAAELERRGHQLMRLPAGSATFGAAVSAGIDSSTGTPFAASDPRNGAWAAAC
jgi:gamma-glutamyltranspeptidase / glutathione hydrolase